jgi:hypothetical protein
MLFTHQEAGSPFQIEFISVEIDGEPAALEHDQLRWAAVEEMEILPLAPSDRAFAQRMLRRFRPPGRPPRGCRLSL